MLLFLIENILSSHVCITIGVKRIMQEAKELAKETAYEFEAHPLEVTFLFNQSLQIILCFALLILFSYRIIYLSGTLLCADPKIRTLKMEGSVILCHGKIILFKDTQVTL